MNTKELGKTLRLCLLAIGLAACAGNLRPVSEVRATATEISSEEMQASYSGRLIASASFNRY